MKKMILVLAAVLLWVIPAQAQTNITIPASLTCSDGFAIVFASGLPTCAATEGVGTVTNTAFTTGKIPKASGGAALVDSLLSESGSVVTTTGTHNATTGYTLNGTALASTHLSDTATLARLASANAFTDNNTFAEDMRVWRSAGVTTGYIHFGSTGSNYLGFDGTRFQFNAAVTVPASARVTSASQALFYATYTGAGALEASFTTYNDTLAVYDHTNSRFVWSYTPSTSVWNTPLAITVGSPTGGAKGNGTINAVAVYDDNVLLSDWVFEEFYDQRVPDKHSSDQPSRVRGPKMDRRLFALTETKTVTQSEKRLPWMPKASEFEAERNIGGMMTRLWIGQEQQQLYIFELESRIVALEKGKK